MKRVSLSSHSPFTAAPLAPTPFVVLSTFKRATKSANGIRDRRIDREGLFNLGLTRIIESISLKFTHVAGKARGLVGCILVTSVQDHRQHFVAV